MYFSKLRNNHANDIMRYRKKLFLQENETSDLQKCRPYGFIHFEPFVLSMTIASDVDVVFVFGFIGLCPFFI